MSRKPVFRIGNGSGEQIQRIDLAWLFARGRPESNSSIKSSFILR
ncbi:hypothetical protein [Thiohalophilus sp.]|nr:hypothetical protein [Thiohalophilus sp.]MDZ7805423.1 hypothetical protein [Thiohalophilus sp.]